MSERAIRGTSFVHIYNAGLMSSRTGENFEVLDCFLLLRPVRDSLERKYDEQGGNTLIVSADTSTVSYKTGDQALEATFPVFNLGHGPSGLQLVQIRRSLIALGRLLELRTVWRTRAPNSTVTVS